MLNLDATSDRLLAEVADLHKVPVGAFNIRANGKAVARNSSANIDIIPKEDVSGIDIKIKPGTKNESVHIPVVMTASGIKEIVYNDFYIGEDSDVVIVAGCGIDNCGPKDSEHDGIHRFFVGKGAKVKYVEKHYGSGDGAGKRILNPGTEVYMEEDSYMEMEMTQIKGVDDTVRDTKAELGKGARLVVHERLMTHGDQKAVSNYRVDLNGEGCSRMIRIRSSMQFSMVTPHAPDTPSAMRSSWITAGSWLFRDLRRITLMRHSCTKPRSVRSPVNSSSN